jgi:hypothetical protein
MMGSFEKLAVLDSETLRVEAKFVADPGTNVVPCATYRNWMIFTLESCIPPLYPFSSSKGLPDGGISLREEILSPKNFIVTTSFTILDFPNFSTITFI